MQASPTKTDVQEFKQLLLEVAAERSLKDVLQLIVTRVASMEHTALSRIWLIDTDERIETSETAKIEPPTKFLQLLASAGQSINDPNADWSRLNGRFSRFPIGERKIGVVAQTGDAIVVWDTTKDKKWIADPEWAERESIRGVAAQPLVFRGEVIGVFAVFMRTPVNVDELIWHRMLADHAAAAIVNARAFEEIDRLKRHLELENEYLREEVASEGAFGEIIGNSPAIRSTTEQIKVVAKTEANVMITGESGTGKELVAREIHRRSERAKGPMVKVNCAAIPQELFESEFFGHAEGAFTGAIRDRAGRFEAADGGTLFLDEVGEIPLALQSKLLRVLQEGTFERIGEEQTREVNVRIVTATNRDLLKESQEGRFREDLYYRLNVFPIEVAPLRQRKQDIPALAKHFLKASCHRMGRPSLRLTKKVAESLRRYDWPGNIRELQNLIERATITAKGTEIQIQLPASDAPSVNDMTKEPPGEILTESQLRQLERNNILKALASTQGKVSGPGGAAGLLGIKASTLTSRMKKMNIRWVAQ
ncbi:sigma-54-dependent Fis family transcriptional regulator [Thalassoroseus pseudoceratinae]|uniref:sigma-54-dependent Fis family transcriptional regulator n=1 Tax=Thalassoroseus pseudoceratinae TaxID=2713176 RepID=UPI001424A1D6|nr:sigma 54-interacting transcriptional regulator [Thalassoroseus pseudoceratinae]